MTAETGLLALSAAMIGVVHTLAGPDHYLPFIALQQSRKWSIKKTLSITAACSLGHTGSSLLIGMAGVVLGLGLKNMDIIEGVRGDWAAWLLFVFGLVYCAYGLYRSWKHPRIHQAMQTEDNNHEHQHIRQEKLGSPSRHIHAATPWILFIIFVLGPCEPLIPLLMVPSMQANWIGLGMVGSAFMLTTMLTMTGIVYLLVKGLEIRPHWNTARYAHLIAGAIITLCGAGMLFFGL